MQGYLYAKPMPADRLQQYLASVAGSEHARESITSS
jgi:hypothetical protein